MQIEVIINEFKVYEYDAPFAPRVGEMVKRLHHDIEMWRVTEVRHVIDDRFKQSRVVLFAEKIL